MKLAINLATRGRPQLVVATIMSTLALIRRSDTVFMVSADDDDAPTIAALESLRAMVGDRLLISIAPREDTIAAKWNRVLAAVPDANAYMPMCDDGPVITADFDERILFAASSFPDGIGVVFNHLENLSFTSVQAVTRRWVDLTGYIYPELFPYWFVDHWLSDVAEMTDRVAFADVALDCASNRPPTMEMREPAFWATFYDACKLRRRAQMRAILAAPDCVTPSWQRGLLLKRYPLVEQYSTMINNGVRAMQVNAPPPDDRYRRIKAAAIALLKTELLAELEDDEHRRAA